MEAALRNTLVKLYVLYWIVNFNKWLVMWHMSLHDTNTIFLINIITEFVYVST